MNEDDFRRRRDEILAGLTEREREVLLERFRDDPRREALTAEVIRRHELNLEAAADVETRYQRLREAIKARIKVRGDDGFLAGADLNDWPVLEGLVRRELGRVADVAVKDRLRQERRERIAAGRAQSPGENETTMPMKPLKNVNKVRPTEPPAPPPPPPPPVSDAPPTVAEALKDIRLELADMRDHTNHVHVERLVELVDRLAEVVEEATAGE